MKHRDLIHVERVDWENIRVFVFEHDENGAKSVKDIFELQFCYDLGRTIYWSHCHGRADVHEEAWEDVNFGRATNPAVRLQKILDHIMRSPWTQ